MMLEVWNYFHPACFHILFRRNWLRTSLCWPLTVTLPFFVGCLNWRWSPAVLTRYQSSSSSSLMTSFTL